ATPTPTPGSAAQAIATTPRAVSANGGWWPRRGVRFGVLAAAATPVVVALGRALSAAARTAVAGWQAGPPATAAVVDLRLPIALAVLLVAAAAMLPRRAVVPVLGAGGVLLVFALPAALPLHWWTPSIVDGVPAAALALAAARTRSGARVIGYGLPAV